MITEQCKNKVYFSNLLHFDYPRLYKDICDILDANNVVHSTLPLTKDYWCRDYMPVQCARNRFVQFIYNPDYLIGSDEYITDADKVFERIKNEDDVIRHSLLKIDGGNVVVCEIDNERSMVVLTDKVMMENPRLSKSEIETQIKKIFDFGEYTSMNKSLIILWLPWDTKDVCGHTDGILRFVGINDQGKPVVLTNLSVYDKDIANGMRSVLKEYFEVKELELSEYNDLSWAYINSLQTRDIIIVPGIGNYKLDNEAMSQIKSLYPQYENRIYQVQMKRFIRKWGGALNCCTWTVNDEISVGNPYGDEPIMP